MTARHLLVITATCLLGTALSFALAELLDLPWLRLVGVALVLAALAARETWNGRDRAASSCSR
jgi:hypothetical protein